MRKVRAATSDLRSASMMLMTFDFVSAGSDFFPIAAFYGLGASSSQQGTQEPETRLTGSPGLRLPVASTDRRYQAKAFRRKRTAVSAPARFASLRVRVANGRNKGSRRRQPAGIMNLWDKKPAKDTLPQRPRMLGQGVVSCWIRMWTKCYCISIFALM